MFKKHPGTADYQEAPTLDELIEAAAAEAEADMKGRKGSARAQLQGHERQLLLMLEKRLPLRKQVEVLSKGGIQVTAVSLHNFLISDFPLEWAKYLAVTARGQKKNRAAEPQEGQQPSTEEGAGNRKEEVAPTPNAPAATGEATTQEAGIDPATLDMSKFYR